MTADWFEPRLWGHRGASAVFPENTLAAFARAIADGATALETDVHRTRDGQWVVFHDPDGVRLTANPGRIAHLTLNEVRSWRIPDPRDPSAVHRVPTLEEVLDAHPGITVSVDIKPRSHRVVASILDLLASRPDRHRVILCSFHDRHVDRLRRAGWDGPTALTRLEVAMLRVFPRVPWPERFRGRSAQIPRRSGPFPLDTRRFVERCHRVGVRVDFWVVNRPEDGRTLLARGADGLISDDPARLAHLFR